MKTVYLLGDWWLQPITPLCSMHIQYVTVCHSLDLGNGYKCYQQTHTVIWSGRSKASFLSHWLAAICMHGSMNFGTGAIHLFFSIWWYAGISTVSMNSATHEWERGLAYPATRCSPTGLHACSLLQPLFQNTEPQMHACMHQMPSIRSFKLTFKDLSIKKKKLSKRSGFQCCDACWS